jgi:hypothetical protein
VSAVSPSAKTLVLPLDTTVEAYASAFEGAKVVYFCSGYTPSIGASAPISREADDAKHKAEGYDDAVKVFDAVEAVKGPKPRLIMMSASDIRDPSKVPAHYVRSPIVSCILCAEWGICASTGRGGPEDVQHAVRNNDILDEVEVRGGQEPD